MNESPSHLHCPGAQPPRFIAESNSQAFPALPRHPIHMEADAVPARNPDPEMISAATIASPRVQGVVVVVYLFLFPRSSPTQHRSGGESVKLTQWSSHALSALP